VLGSVAPKAEVQVVSIAQDDDRIEGSRIERVVLEVEPGILVPLILLHPRERTAAPRDRRTPVVVAVAQAGKSGFLGRRAGLIARLLAGGVSVCLPDLRGLGETKPEGSRERWGALTAQASTALMLGDPLVAARLRDLRGVLAYLRGHENLDTNRIALWGDSFAAPNPPGRNFRVPRNVDDRPRWSEPLGGLLALLGALYEDEVRAVYVRGGLSAFASVVRDPFVYLPPDVVIPGLLTAGDLPDLAAALAPNPLRMDELVGGFNRLEPADRVHAIYRSAQEAYARAGAPGRMILYDVSTSPADWLLQQLAVR